MRTARAASSLELQLPDSLTSEQRELLADLVERNDAEHGPGLLGIVLTGSAGRGLSTERSDLDVYVVLNDAVAQERVTTRSSVVDEIPLAMSELLHEVPPFGSGGWWRRWSFAWAPTLLDRTGGQIPAATRRQATLTPEEADSVLLEHDRLDGWVNYAYRSLKSDRDGRVMERRLDGVESVPWLLDVVFTLAGRVRPYHKYLPWELSEHPLPNWPAEVLLDLLGRTIDGDPDAIRETFSRVTAACAESDTQRGSSRLADIVDSWGHELQIFRDSGDRVGKPEPGQRLGWANLSRVSVSGGET